MFNELETELDNLNKPKKIYVSRAFYKSIRRTKKELQRQYGVKIRRKRK